MIRTPFPALSNIDTLRKAKYDIQMTDSIRTATLLKSLEKCDTLNTNMHNLIKNQNRYRTADRPSLPLSLSRSSRIFTLLVPTHSSIFTNNDHLMISFHWYRCCLVSDSFHKSHWVSIKVCYDSPPTAINSTSSGQNPLSTTVFLLLKISSISF